MLWRARLFTLSLALSGLSFEHARAEEDRLEQITQLAEVGASSFALHLLERYQPVFADEPDVWVHWERQRTLIYIDTHDWSALLDRALSRPDGLPSDFLRWQETRVARAWLELGEAQKARRLLTALIWKTPPSHRAAYFAHWRELIIRTYLAASLYGDAHTAWLRYRLDYGESSPPDNALSAEVLLRTGQHEVASTHLKSPKTGRERLLAAIIESELGVLDISQMWHRVESLLSTGRFDPTLALEAWGALASAAVRAKDTSLSCQVLERALTLVLQRPALASEAGINGDALWDSYEGLASEIANRNQLLIGRFDEWLVLIEDGSVLPVVKRALLAFMVLNGPQEIRAVAEPLLVASLLREPQGKRIVQALYLATSRAYLADDITDIVRFPLLELALTDADLVLARRLGQEVTDSALLSKIIEARIVLREQPLTGVELIKSSLAQTQDLTPEELGQFQTALNELGGILPDAEVIELLEQLRSKAHNLPVSGEIQLSIGAIQTRQLKFQQAAMSFLKASRSTSDVYIERQALIEAARALTLARMKEQAREIYRQVLAKPLHDEVRQQITRELKQLGIPL